MKNRLVVGLVALSVLGFPVAYGADPKPAPDDKAFQEYASQMQAHMKLMQDQMQKMRQTNDPALRQKLMQEHWTAMQDGMRMMHGSDSMPGCSIMMGTMSDDMGCCSGGHRQGKVGGMHGKGWWNPQDTSSQAMNRRQQMMGTCMGMQQQMMDQMMQQQNYRWMPPAQ